MKALGAVRLGLEMVGIFLVGTALAQRPGAKMRPDSEPRVREHRPPLERAFGAQGAAGRWWNNPRIVERLKLTNEQRKAFDNILLEHREKLIDLRAGLQKAELALEPLMRGNPPDEAAILAQIDKVAQARAELEKANAGFLLAIRSRLTPEQWEQLQAARANQGQTRGQGPIGQYRSQPLPASPPSPEDEQPLAEPPASAAPGAGAV